MKKTFQVLYTLLAGALALSCMSGCGSSVGGAALRQEAASSAATAAPYEETAALSQETQAAQAAISIPDPARVLPAATVTQTDQVELEIDGEAYLFTQYVYSFSGDSNLTDSTDFLTYQMLARGDGLELEYLYGDGVYSEYAILQGEYFLGYLTEDIGQWVLYLPGSVALDSTPNGSSGTFQNDSFGITVEPGESVPDAGETYIRCEACGGSGICDACGGDGWADNIYYGEHDAFECAVCNQTGDCPVCDGTGQW